LVYIPVSFPWIIFFIGLGVIITGVVLFYNRNKLAKSS
jgi:hypothetical protein